MGGGVGKEEGERDGMKGEGEVGGVRKEEGERD